MKTIKIFLLLTVLLISQFSNAQNVGIGNTSPNARLHITDSGKIGLLIENFNKLDTGIVSTMYFGNAIDSASARYTGAIKTIGNTYNKARLSFFTFAVANPAGLKERMTISDDGNIGIGSIDPKASLHIVNDINVTPLMLENPIDLYDGNTNGILFTNNMANPDPTSYKFAGAMKSIGTSNNSARLGFFTFASKNEAGLTERLSILDGGNVGIEQVNPAFKLDVNGTIHSTGSVTFDGNATVNNGLAVLAGNNGTRRKVATGSFSITINGLASNALSAAAALSLGGFGFTAPPSIYVGNVINKNGDYYKAQVVIEDVTATSANARLFNPTSAPISVSGASWELIIVGIY